MEFIGGGGSGEQTAMRGTRNAMLISVFIISRENWKITTVTVNRNNSLTRNAGRYAMNSSLDL